MTTVNEITTDRLRQLAEARQAHGKVLSIFVNLDPRHFAAPPARATEINSVLDAAERAIRERNHLTHDERAGLERDLERVRSELRSVDASGARGLAIFCCGTSDLFQVLKLPRPVDHHVSIGDAPYVEPLARIGARETWWVLLVDRRRARLLTGSADGLVDTWTIDNDTKGQHDQGGWSQARYQRSVDRDAENHMREIADEIQRRLRTTRIDGLLIGGPAEAIGTFEALLHPDVARCVVGRIEGVDLGNATNADVLNAAEPVLREHRRRRDEELLARFAEGLGTNGRACAGLKDTLAAVTERRVETLLVAETFSAAGVRCPRCGWLGVTAGSSCPADGAVTEPVPDVVEAAVEATFMQDATVRYLENDVLAEHGGIGAVTRF